MKRNKLRKAYRVKRKKSILKNRFFRLAVLLFLLLGGVFYILFFSPIFRIKNIQISGNEKILSENIEAKIRTEMFAKYGDNIFRYDSGKIENEFLSIFPEIAEIELKRSFPDNLKIKIKERDPVAIFCQNENCFSLDENGVIFTRLPASLPAGEVGQEEISSEGLPKIENQTFALEAEVGDEVIGENLLSQIFKIENKLKEDLKISIKEFSIVSEQRLNVKTSELWEVYFNLKSDLDWQIQELAVILKEKLPLQKRKNLEYIDLRFDKVFIYPEIK